MIARTPQFAGCHIRWDATLVWARDKWRDGKWHFTIDYAAMLCHPRTQQNVIRLFPPGRNQLPLASFGIEQSEKGCCGSTLWGHRDTGAQPFTTLEMLAQRTVRMGWNCVISLSTNYIAYYLGVCLDVFPWGCIPSRCCFVRKLLQPTAILHWK